MKKTRFIAFMLSLLMLISMCPEATAEEAPRHITIGLQLNTNVGDYEANAWTLFLEEEMNIDIVSTVPNFFILFSENLLFWHFQWLQHYGIDNFIVHYYNRHRGGK